MVAKVYERNATPAPVLEAAKSDETPYRYKLLFWELKFVNRIISWRSLFSLMCVCLFCLNLLTTGVATTILSTIQKEFYLTSTETGFFLAIYEIAAFLSAPVFGFYGSLPRANKLRLISISFFIVSLGAYLAFLIIFLKQAVLSDTSSGPVSNASNTSQTENAAKYGTCLVSLSNTSSESNCQLTRNQIRASNARYVPNLQYMLYAGHFLIGLGSVAMYTVGVAFIEEIVPKKVSSYCQAIYFGVGSIGGGIGLLLTGQMLNINARFFVKGYVTPGMNPKKPGWIGAW